MPLRNVLRTPRRTLMTVMGLGAVIAMVVAIGGMVDSFDATVAKARAETERGRPDRTVVTLDTPRPVVRPRCGRSSAQPAVGAAEPGAAAARPG